MEDHAVGYTRVSSNKHLEDGGVAAQEASIHAYCLQDDLRLLRIDRDQAGTRVLSIIGPDGDGNENTNDLIHRVLGAVDQYNKAVIRAKTEASQADAGAEGRRGPSQVPDEQEVLARTGQLRGAGASLRAICRELNDAGAPARAGGRWRPHDVSDALHTGALGDEAR